MFASFPFRGFAKSDVKNPKKVLVVQMAKLGDMVCTTPMFRAIKDKYPDCHVTVIGNGVNEMILKDNPDVDEYIVFEGAKSLRNKLRGKNFDFACITSPHLLILCILFISRIRSIATPTVLGGYSPLQTLPYSIASQLVIRKNHHMRQYAPREYLRLLEPLDIYTDDTKKYLSFSDEAARHAEDFLNENGVGEEDFLVCISPSAGNKIKEWPSERFAKVIDYIYNKYGYKILIIGSGNDADKVSETLSLLSKDIKVISALSKLNIDELKAVMSRVNLFLSVDTGPIYIAEAFDVPTIDITGPVDENVQPPTGKFHKLVLPRYRKSPEVFIMNAKKYNRAEALKQLDSIDVKMVTDTVDDLITEIKNENV